MTQQKKLDENRKSRLCKHLSDCFFVTDIYHLIALTVYVYEKILFSSVSFYTNSIKFCFLFSDINVCVHFIHLCDYSYIDQVTLEKIPI